MDPSTASGGFSSYSPINESPTKSASKMHGGESANGAFPLQADKKARQQAQSKNVARAAAPLIHYRGGKKSAQAAYKTLSKEAREEQKTSFYQQRARQQESRKLVDSIEMEARAVVEDMLSSIMSPEDHEEGVESDKNKTDEEKNKDEGLSGEGAVKSPLSKIQEKESFNEGGGKQEYEGEHSLYVEQRRDSLFEGLSNTQMIAASSEQIKGIDHPLPSLSPDISISATRTQLPVHSVSSDAIKSPDDPLALLKEKVISCPSHELDSFISNLSSDESKKLFQLSKQQDFVKSYPAVFEAMDAKLLAITQGFTDDIGSSAARLQGEPKSVLLYLDKKLEMKKDSLSPEEKRSVDILKAYASVPLISKLSGKVVLPPQEKKELSQKLCRSLCALQSPAKFFHQGRCCLDAYAKASDYKAVKEFAQFALDWSKKNHDTRLYPREELIAIAHRLSEIDGNTSEIDEIKQLAADLQKEATEKVKTEFKEVPVGAKSFSNFMNDLKKGGRADQASYHKSVEGLSRDLLVLQRHVYQQLTPDGLISAVTAKNAEDKQDLALSTTIVNGLNKLVAQSLVEAGSPDERAFLVSFYGDVADKCMKHGDYFSASILFSGLGSSPVYRLSPIEEVGQISRIENEEEFKREVASLKDEGLKRAASTWRNFRKKEAGNLREMRKDRADLLTNSSAPPFFFPVQRIATDLTFMNDGNPEVVDLELNSKRLNFFDKDLHEVEAMVGRVDLSSKKEALSPTTDLFKAIEASNAISDGDLYDISLAVQPRNKLVEILPRQSFEDRMKYHAQSLPVHRVHDYFKEHALDEQVVKGSIDNAIYKYFEQKAKNQGVDPKKFIKDHAKDVQVLQNSVRLDVYKKLQSELRNKDFNPELGLSKSTLLEAVKTSFEGSVEADIQSISNQSILKSFSLSNLKRNKFAVIDFIKNCLKLPYAIKSRLCFPEAHSFFENPKHEIGRGLQASIKKGADLEAAKICFRGDQNKLKKYEVLRNISTPNGEQQKELEDLEKEALGFNHIREAIRFANYRALEEMLFKGKRPELQQLKDERGIQYGEYKWEMVIPEDLQYIHELALRKHEFAQASRIFTEPSFISFDNQSIAHLLQRVEVASEKDKKILLENMKNALLDRLDVNPGFIKNGRLKELLGDAEEKLKRALPGFDTLLKGLEEESIQREHKYEHLNLEDAARAQVAERRPQADARRAQIQLLFQDDDLSFNQKLGLCELSSEFCLKEEGQNWKKELFEKTRNFVSRIYPDPLDGEKREVIFEEIVLSHLLEMEYVLLIDSTVKFNMSFFVPENLSVDGASERARQLMFEDAKRAVEAFQSVTMDNLRAYVSSVIAFFDTASGIGSAEEIDQAKSKLLGHLGAVIEESGGLRHKELSWIKGTGSEAEFLKNKFYTEYRSLSGRAV